VLLLPAYDPWVIGAGTDDLHIVPPARRKLVSGGANLVIVGGVVCGTWSLAEHAITIAWFPEAGLPPDQALAEAVGRLATILGRSLKPTVRRLP
jgi:hypothetical protein